MPTKVPSSISIGVLNMHQCPRAANYVQVHHIALVNVVRRPGTLGFSFLLRLLPPVNPATIALNVCATLPTTNTKRGEPARGVPPILAQSAGSHALPILSCRLGELSKRGGTGITNRRLALKSHGGANRQQRPALFAALPGAAPGCSPTPEVQKTSSISAAQLCAPCQSALTCPTFH
jgi:hypothetical protein